MRMQQAQHEFNLPYFMYKSKSNYKNQFNLSKTKPKMNNITFQTTFNNNPQNSKQSQHNGSFYQTISSFQDYNKGKSTFQMKSSSRNSKQKQVTNLSRTQKKLHQQVEKNKAELLKNIWKKMQSQQKLSIKQNANNQRKKWLQQQKNQNSTKKYLHYVAKYQSKINLLNNNKKQAQKIKQLSQSASSLKSLKNWSEQKNLKDRASYLRRNSIQSRQRSKQSMRSRIADTSSKVRQQKKSIYLQKAQSEHQYILRLEQRQKVLTKTIQNSKKDKLLYTKILNQSKYQNSTKTIDLLIKNNKLDSSKQRPSINSRHKNRVLNQEIKQKTKNNQIKHTKKKQINHTKNISSFQCQDLLADF